MLRLIFDSLADLEGIILSRLIRCGNLFRSQARCFDGAVNDQP